MQTPDTCAGVVLMVICLVAGICEFHGLSLCVCYLGVNVLQYQQLSIDKSLCQVGSLVRGRQSFCLIRCPRALQVANYREFAEARAAQLGRTFDDLLNPHRSTSVSGQALLCTPPRADFPPSPPSMPARQNRSAPVCSVLLSVWSTCRQAALLQTILKPKP